MSATAATNQLEMKHFGYAVNLHNWWNFNKWCSGVGAEFNAQYGGMTVDMKTEKAREGMRWIHDQMFNVQAIASRLTRECMKAMFPDNHVMAECFDMGGNTAKIQRVYEQMEAELAALEESSANYSQHHFAIMTKARRLTELLKVPTMVEMIEDWFDEGISPVVFVNFTDTVEAIEKQLKKNKKFDGLIAKIVGGQSDKSRQADIDGFQNDTKRIMIANLAAGNAGISLHDLNGKFPRGSVISPSYSAINTLQSLGRCHRANGKTPVIQRFFFADGVEIEQKMRARVSLRLENLDCLNDGDFSINN